MPDYLVPPRLSAAMSEGLKIVPLDWQKPLRDIRFRGRIVEHPLFQPTFVALRKRGLIEYRGGPGTWEWRQKPRKLEGEDLLGALKAVVQYARSTQGFSSAEGQAVLDVAKVAIDRAEGRLP